MTGGRERGGKQLLIEIKVKRRRGNLNMKHYIALCGELAFEEAVGLL